MSLYRTFFVLGLIALLLIAPALVVVTPAQAATPVTMTCPFTNSGSGDNLGRGFYIVFTGDTLDTVTLQYAVNTTDNYSVTLTARLSAFDGALVGQDTQAFAGTASTLQQVTFNFGGASVPAGSTITFAQVQNTGTAAGFHIDTGVEPCAGFTQTNGTTPPLDSFRRDSIGAIVTGSLGATGTGLAGPDMVSMPARAVVGTFTQDTPLYYAPAAGATSTYAMSAGQSLWVLGLDASGQFYQVLLSGQLSWVPVGTIGPNYDEVWNGTPLPTTTVQ